MFKMLKSYFLKEEETELLEIMKQMKKGNETNIPSDDLIMQFSMLIEDIEKKSDEAIKPIKEEYRMAG